MEDTLEENQDFALVIAWPDQTARGDEWWMAFLKQIGIVKNLNFKVGHAAIVLGHRKSGALAYYDFGRYVTPRGYGRARSAASDPRLALNVHARFDPEGQISNLPAIMAELRDMEYATHGGGRLFFSVATGLSFSASTHFAQHVVDRGPVKYGAIARANNSCSRFVAQVLLAGLPTGHPARLRIRVPESIKPSPMSNVVNASPDRFIHCYHEGSLQSLRMDRWQSLRFQLDLLFHNLSTSKAKALPCDRVPGNLVEPHRPSCVPTSAQWLGGIGEGAWYLLARDTETDALEIVKYASDGREDYRMHYAATGDIDPNLPHQFTYHCHFLRHVIVQNGENIVLEITNCTDRHIRIA